MRLLAIFFTLILSLPASVPAWAQNNDMRAVMSRMDQLQRQMDTVSRQVYSGKPPPAAIGMTTGSDTAGMAAAYDERMSGMEGSLRQINNRLDEQDNALSQMKQQFELFKSDLEMRLKEASAGTSASGAVAAPEKAVTATATTMDEKPVSASSTAATETAAAGAVQDLPTANAASLYDTAFQWLREQKYVEAQAGFKEFMKLYANDALAGNAQYWLGETYYVQGNYADAAKVFAQGYQKYPKSSKAPDNLLKLGLSLSQSGKKQEACVTLQQLGKQYGNAAAVIKQRAEDEAKKLNCGASNG